MLTEVVIVLCAIPEAGERVSQEALLLAVHWTVPEPELVTEIVWEVGFPWPWNAEKERPAGLRESVGGAMVKLTGTLIGELVALALTTIVSV